ncbi:DNA repair helicase XPB [Natronoglycomyces albus]|uniref:DNA repair helicase XPB n=1 Tax=Natronoglycomyces albus TaxID=2811108 RepID=UPI001FE81E9D|nr:DNA repair helicase XPB [Natronoglycomyces albus]
MSGPLIVQSDRSLLLEVDHPQAEQCRLAISAFAELERAPEHIHTYRLSPLGLWNAASAGYDAETVIDILLTYAKFPPSHEILLDVSEQMSRFGVLRLEDHPSHGLVLTSSDPAALTEVIDSKHTTAMLGSRIEPDIVAVHPSQRGALKQALLHLLWPVDDRAGYVDGEAHPITLVEDGWSLRPYQKAAVDSFSQAGSGVCVLPCGAGKTVVGAAAMARASATTLILVTNTVAARQWRDELLRRTSLTAEEIGEYSGERKQIRPVTIATYQVVTYRRNKQFQHLELFAARDWGLVIYDEVHLLPAPVFRMAADMQARRRLGLTATLVREDGRETDVFSLIGPCRFEAPWRELEQQGWIAPASCTEVRVRPERSELLASLEADDADRYRVAASARSKVAVVKDLIAEHSGEQILVIGAYLDQLEDLAHKLGAPLVQGSTSTSEREDLFAKFRSGEVTVLVISRVGNHSVDLPDATVCIQVSGTFGSRQEEAQRLGRVLRSKPDGRRAHFYAVVTSDTVDVEYAASRQRFLTEQGYSYQITDAGGS